MSRVIFFRLRLHSCFKPSSRRVRSLLFSVCGSKFLTEHQLIRQLMQLATE